MEKKDDGGIGESNRFQTINDHMSQLQEWNPNSCRIVTGDLLETTMEWIHLWSCTTFVITSPVSIEQVLKYQMCSHLWYCLWRRCFNVTPKDFVPHTGIGLSGGSLYEVWEDQLFFILFFNHLPHFSIWLEFWSEFSKLESHLISLVTQGYIIAQRLT